MKRLLLVVLAIACASCLGTPEEQSGNGLDIRLDSARNVACYKIRNVEGISCVLVKP